ncbi:RNA polymerase sigma factor [Fulvivirga sp. M361]|uniref:RNA polymerase sigma factor n=1 Tax=Fulvivirga sp. M361 TaxID=2594266 RepID=UPI0011799830|nr:RNA polymerase sigma factor [Fulvivirga sp. M361]TRX60643.1 RNA polymerase sigma factor [Fulvivirga sp. M361]
MTFEAVFEAYWQRVFRLCMGYVNNNDMAKDLAQETFIKVWQQLPKFRNESSIGTWVFRIASNQCLRQIEKEGKMLKTEIPCDLKDTSHVDIEMEDKIKILYRYISELLEVDRIIISLELEDIRQTEIANIVGISEANVRVKIHRIKRKILQKFKNHE